MTDRQLMQLSPRHQQLARLLVGGHSQSEIAKLLTLHKSTVSRIVRDPKVLNEVKRLQEFANVNAVVCVPGIPEKIAEGAQKGTEVLLEILADERTTPEMLKLKANVALELLSRAGYGPTKQMKIESAAISAYFTTDEIEAFKERGLKAMAECGLVVDGVRLNRD
ncbi:MAG: hypothetical protein RBT11_01210 [Desulfobacterales bacterium]|jgi:predicted transcriptional regulator|nr:hypothetical protein [Desulfobacterales bacterium]